MKFVTDKQTLDDLNLLGKYKSHSIFSVFNQVKTKGGEQLLEQMFRNPLTDKGAINSRSSAFKYFQGRKINFIISPESIEIMETYLQAPTGTSNRLASSIQIIVKKWMNEAGLDKHYENLSLEITSTIKVLNELRSILDQLDHQCPTEILAVKNIVEGNQFNWLDTEKGDTLLSVNNTIRYNNILRKSARGEMMKILQAIYYLDVYIAVSNIATVKSFNYATAGNTTGIKIKNCFHPGISNAIANSVLMQPDSNVIFLTGANMAGKSTFMKSVAIAVYLAHMGFPVAAESMDFSLFDGIYTSINVPDNLQLGYSHFYAEVKRVKTVAENVASGKNILVIFDELFKGTNVKDAYDATLAVTTAFAKYKNCLFIISTHIIEVGDQLRQSADNMQFLYFATIMDGNIARYPYKLQEGITIDRHGMIIIEKENLVEMIRKIN